MAVKEGLLLEFLDASKHHVRNHIVAIQDRVKILKIRVTGSICKNRPCEGIGTFCTLVDVLPVVLSLYHRIINGCAIHCDPANHIFIQCLQLRKSQRVLLRLIYSVLLCRGLLC